MLKGLWTDLTSSIYKATTGLKMQVFQAGENKLQAISTDLQNKLTIVVPPPSMPAPLVPQYLDSFEDTRLAQQKEIGDLSKFVKLAVFGVIGFYGVVVVLKVIGNR